MSIVCFGELLLRLKAPGSERILQTPSFDATFCGAEANVAVDLAYWGEETTYVTALPNNALGDAAIRELRSWGVGTKYISRGGERLGTLYLEAGANQRPSKVIYDRSYSSISQVDVASIPWQKVFQDATWFHISGITPAISKSAAEVALEAVKEAHSNGVCISCDLNYRSSLWKYGCQAQEVMKKLVEQTDVLIANEEDIQCSLGIGPEIEVKEQLTTTHYQHLAELVSKVYPNLQVIGITLRESHGASYNDWSACIYSADDKFFSRSEVYQIHNIVDRVGAGDCFAAGLIYGLIHNMSKQQALDFAVAASCLKHSIAGDFARISTEEIYRLMAGNGSGRVIR